MRNVIAGGRVIAATGVGTNIFGCVTGRTGAGVYTITMSEIDVDITECMIIVTPINAAARIATIAHTTDALKGVNIFDAAGAAADSDFSFTIYR
jgi:hypothetical protein